MIPRRNTAGSHTGREEAHHFCSWLLRSGEDLLALRLKVLRGLLSKNRHSWSTFTAAVAHPATPALALTTLQFVSTSWLTLARTDTLCLGLPCHTIDVLLTATKPSLCCCCCPCAANTSAVPPQSRRTPLATAAMSRATMARANFKKYIDITNPLVRATAAAFRG